mmetsp:Transcript_2957/g.7490  ORF Transcript_2957/g.7490 Transcript_2957/m.7490 type:complete len:217 (+) Transcript_2957:2-652(+)
MKFPPVAKSVFLATLSLLPSSMAFNPSSSSVTVTRATAMAFRRGGGHSHRASTRLPVHARSGGAATVNYYSTAAAVNAWTPRTFVRGVGLNAALPLSLRGGSSSSSSTSSSGGGGGCSFGSGALFPKAGGSGGAVVSFGHRRCGGHCCQCHRIGNGGRCSCNCWSGRRSRGAFLGRVLSEKRAGHLCQLLDAVGPRSLGSFALARLGNFLVGSGPC